MGKYLVQSQRTCYLCIIQAQHLIYRACCVESFVTEYAMTLIKSIKMSLCIWPLIDNRMKMFEIIWWHVNTYPGSCQSVAENMFDGGKKTHQLACIRNAFNCFSKFSLGICVWVAKADITPNYTLSDKQFRNACCHTVVLYRIHKNNE